MALAAGTPVETRATSEPIHIVNVNSNLAVNISGNEARFIDITGGVLNAGSLGAVHTWTADSVDNVDACLMDTDEILVVYETGATVKAVALTLNIGAQTISSGAASTIDTAASSVGTVRCTKLLTTKAFLVWSNQSVGGHGFRAYGCTLTYPGLSPGTIDYISKTNPTIFTDPGFFETSCVALDSGRIFAAYSSDDNGVDGKWYGVVLTAGATTFTRGTEAVLDSDTFSDGADDRSNRDLILFDTNKVVAVNLELDFVVATTVSDVVSPGSLLNIPQSIPGLDYGDMSTVLASYFDGTNGKIQTLGLSSTTLTDNAASIVFAATTTIVYQVPVRMGTTYAIVAYASSSANKSFAVLISGVPAIPASFGVAESAGGIPGSI